MYFYVNMKPFLIFDYNTIQAKHPVTIEASDLPYQQCVGTVNRSLLSLLSLVRDFDRFVAQLQACRSFLGRNRTRLVFIFRKRNPFSAGNHAHLLESGETAENRRERGLRVVFGQLAQEEDFVRRQVFVGHHSASVRARF